MNYSFKVPPIPCYTAEVVILITSLGVKRKEYNTSRRVMDLLEVMRCHYKLIDFNIDTGGDDYGSGSKPDLDIVRNLYQSHRVKQDSRDGMISLPQVLIDGVNIGDHIDLQALEDDGLLDGMLRREICPQCCSERSGEYCYECKTLFQEIMPKRQTYEDFIHRLKRQRIPFKDLEDSESDHDERDEEFIHEVAGQ